MTVAIKAGDIEAAAEFTDGDVAAARLLRDNLARPAEQVDDRVLREDIRSVLAGRKGFRALADTPALTAVVREGVRELEEAWDRMTPEQRDAEVPAGRERGARTRPG
jgi:hypothetical protein